MAEPRNPPLDYIRRLYDNVVDWYETAERKAQIVLTVDGLFLGLLTASFTSDVADLRAVVTTFSSRTWGCLVVASVLLLTSLLSAVWCLRSRHIYDPEAHPRRTRRPALKALPHAPASVVRNFADAGKRLWREPGFPRNEAETMWFFEMIAKTKQAHFMMEARCMDEPREIDALASQVWRLSNIVAEKHIWANRAFAATGLALVAFTLAAASYVGFDLSS